MYDIAETFWEATLAELKQGYVFKREADAWQCLVCGECFERGEVFRDGERYFEAEKFVQIHVAQKHGGMFQYLIGLDKKQTGLTDLQKQLLQHFREGKTDSEIVKEMGGGSTSTIRNHRFALREKAKQAKLFQAILELVEEQPAADSRFLPIHRTATMLDDRYVITEKEHDEVLRKYFPEGPSGSLTEFPRKEKRKLSILRELIKRFTPGVVYSEKEVNAILSTAHSDYATLRRYLIEYGLLDREADGSRYWVKQ